MQYLYSDDMYHFMNTENYDQIDMSADQVGDSLKFVKENEMVKMLSHNNEIFAIEPPLFVELEVTETEPGFKGDTAQGANKLLSLRQVLRLMYRFSLRLVTRSVLIHVQVST